MCGTGHMMILAHNDPASIITQNFPYSADR